MKFTKLYDEVQMVWKSDTRRDYARNRSDYASSTTDKEWERILPQLPKEKARGRPRKHDLRRILDGIFYLLQSGCQWDMLPKDFPPWQTVYRYFRDWRKDGTWARLHDALYRDMVPYFSSQKRMSRAFQQTKLKQCTI